MKRGQMKFLEIVDGHPVVVRIVDYLYNELAKDPDNKLIKDGTADLLAESKRLNDSFNGRL